jgi:hypothetical protein
MNATVGLLSAIVVQMQLPQLQTDLTMDGSTTAPARPARNSAAREIAHALNSVTAIIVSTVSLLRNASRSEADKSLLNLLEHAARRAEELGSRVAGLGPPITVSPAKAKEC